MDALRKRLEERYDTNDPEQALLIERVLSATLRLNRTRTLITERLEHLAGLEYSAISQRQELAHSYMVQANLLLREQYGSSPGIAILKALAEKVGLKIKRSDVCHGSLILLTRYAQRFRSQRDSAMKKLETLKSSP